MAEAHRPLSPHLQVYRWRISNSLSIVHRLTGVGLSIGALVLVAWLLTVASGQDAVARFNGLFQSLIGQFLLLGWTFSFFYHLCNGIRHLAWDLGRGFDKTVARKSGIAVVIGAVLFTVAFWAVAFGGGA